MNHPSPLKHARSELSIAAKSVARMENAASFNDFEEEWKTFLASLEKSWSKVEQACRPFATKFQPWQGKFCRQRRKDMLLSYLKQARNADTHSIQEIAQMDPGGIGYRFNNPKGGKIRSMRIVDGVFVHYDGDPMTGEVIPAQPVAIRVKNRGHWYNPPTSHLGSPINSRNPLELARLGLAFYQSFVDEAEAKFFPSTK